MKKSINVCFCGNNDYITYIGVALQSILVNLDPDYTLNVFLICDFADQKNRKKLHKTLKGHNLHILPIDPKKLEGIKVCGYPGIETYFRLFIQEYVEVDKILYLDGDIIINTDIALLYEIDL
jgi:lipopolysaccharide biosynthesis glycosyltransferase